MPGDRLPGEYARKRAERLRAARLERYRSRRRVVILGAVFAFMAGVALPHMYVAAAESAFGVELTTNTGSWAIWMGILLAVGALNR